MSKKRTHKSRGLHHTSSNASFIANKGASLVTAMVVAVSLGTSGLLMSQSAHAFTFDDVKQVMGAIRSIVQSDFLKAAFDTHTTQTAMAAKSVGEGMKETAQAKAIFDSSANTALTIQKVSQDLKMGKGVTTEMQCTPQAEKVVIQNKGQMSKSNAAGQMMVAASEYVQKDSSRLAQRTKSHVNGFCDITEVAQGACLPLPNGLGGADSDYSVMYGHDLLLDDVEIAAHAFVTNLIDPSKSTYNTCDTLSCNALVDTESRYASLASLVQNSFLAQINDGKLLMPSTGDNQQTVKEAAESGVKLTDAKPTASAPATTATNKPTTSSSASTTKPTTVKPTTGKK